MTMEVKCKLCMSANTNLIEVINSKPDVEVDYGIPPALYQRSIYKCSNCGVYFNDHNLINFNKFYQGKYNNSISKESLLKRFNKIIDIPKNKSDNHSRVQRVTEFLRSKHQDILELKVLDVGSGTCVFLNEIKKHIKNIYCIDPDPVAIDHAKNIVGVTDAHLGNILNYSPSITFDFISFNKVLEHVIDPINNLRTAKNFLNKNGVVYVELPEGDRILNINLIAKRAEFALEHITIFNEQSIKYLADKSGFNVLDFSIITDPSGKYTIISFLEKK